MSLETSALRGGLSGLQTTCLEERYAAAVRQTDRRQLSLLLIADANGKGDKRAWEDLVGRHLEHIDQSNPDICYAYATHLARKGPGRAETVIHWSDVALEQRSRWDGETYNTRVYGLYKLRAAAANTLFRRAEERDDALQTDETYRRAQGAQSRLQTYSREWYVAAQAVGKDTTTPLQLCVSATGGTAFCQGHE